ncbi:MAG: hydroxyacid dehydrogenase [Hyphomicrobiaceae bacterium]|nr:hydroxyacid dehydrogenase [Hyphomicrobiaceae bacterium]
MTKPRILLTHTPEMRRNYYGDRALAGLRELGTVLLHEAEDPLDAAGLARAAACAHIIVSDRNTPGYGDIFGRLDDLVAFLRVAVDIRNVDVAAASRAGVLVTHARRTWVPAVSELVVGHMIGIARGIPDMVIAYRQGAAAEAAMGRQLDGSVAGIIGYGPLGRNVAELLLAFGMTVLVNDPYVTVERQGIEQVPLDELVRRADFVVPLAVATEETENLIGEAELKAMKPTAYLVNLSRGNLIDEAALERALDERWIAGAALDVGRAPDQMPSPNLARRPDVIATPHMGGLTQAGIEGQALETVVQVNEILKGRAPEGAVNDEHARRLQRFAGQ